MAADIDTLTRRLAVAGVLIQLFALLVLACVRSDKFVIFAYDLPPGGLANEIVEVAEIWDGWMDGLGVAAVRQHVIDAIGAMRGKDDGF